MSDAESPNAEVGGVEVWRGGVNTWECDENGVGAIRDPFCDKEQAAAVKCIEANLGRM